MKNLDEYSHKAVWGIAAAYVGGMLMFGVFSWIGKNPIDGGIAFKPLYSSADKVRFIGPPVCVPDVGDTRCKSGFTQYGMVDGVSSSIITGWLYSQKVPNGNAEVAITFTDVANKNVRYSKTVSLTENRTDIESYFKSQLPGLTVLEPIGFVVNPLEVVQKAGTYRISATEQVTGLGLEVAPQLSEVTIEAK